MGIPVPGCISITGQETTSSAENFISLQETADWLLKNTVNHLRSETEHLSPLKEFCATKKRLRFGAVLLLHDIYEYRVF